MFSQLTVFRGTEGGLYLKFHVYYSIYVQFISSLYMAVWFTLLCKEVEQEEVVSFELSCLCHKYNCMEFQHVLHLRFHVYYSI